MTDSLDEPAVFGAVFDRHHAAVHAFAQRRRYDGRPDPLPWPLGIATNLICRHWRSERRRPDAYARVAAQAHPATGTSSG